MKAGGLWNTLVIVARVETLWNLGRQYLPAVVERFETWRPLVGTPQEDTALEKMYADMPVQDFSRDLLEPSADFWGAFELRDLLWSDWGRPERILQTLVTIGRAPAFGRGPFADGSALTSEVCLAER
jgi:mannose-1-phosphate guanylyltransferase